MPNVVEFLVPDPAQLPLSYGLKPALFRAQFVPMMLPAPGATPLTLPLPDPSIPGDYAQLLAAALDSGYGTGAAPMPSMALADRVAMYCHLEQQLELALTLLKRLPNGNWVRQPFAAELEKTGKTSHSYLLGMLYASIATRLWGQANGWGEVREFWHYGVLASRAANFMVGVAYAEENPDFLVEFDGGSGTWACVEAKGSLSDQNDDVLKTGLSQACKLTQIKWQTVGAPATVVSPAQQACVMTYFSPPNDTLEVLVLDPPADSLAQSDSQARLLFREGGDFVRWAQAIEQFEAMASVSQGHDSRLELHRFDWARSSRSHLVWVGVPKIMRRHIKTLDMALSLLDWLVPILSDWCKKPSVTARGVNRRLSNMARFASRRANIVETEERTNLRIWARIALFLNERRKGNKEVISWTKVLREIWTLEIFPESPSPSELPNRPVKSLLDLWTLFTSELAIERDYWELRANDDVDETQRITVAKTSHGLFVVALGSYPERAPKTRRQWPGL